MAFPSNPTNGDIATVNDTDYIYDSSVRSWTRLPTANVTVGNLVTTNGVFWSSNGAAYSSGGGAAPDAADSGLVTDSPTVTSNLGLVTELVSTETDYGSVVADIYGVIYGNLIYANSIPGNRLVSTTDITVANVTATDSVVADAIASNYITASDIDVVTLTTTGTANVEILTATNLTATGTANIGSGSGNVITASGDVVVTGNLVIKKTLIGGENLTVTGNINSNGNVTDSKGNLRDVPVSDKTSSYQLVASDSGKVISITTGGVTVPSATFTSGQAITIYNNSGTSQTITQGSGITMTQASTGLTGNRTLGGYGLCTVLCIATNTFVISGAGLT